MNECNLSIPVPSEGSTYCVSAKGHFFDDLIVGASSEESCIWVPITQAWSKQILKSYKESIESDQRYDTASCSSCGAAMGSLGYLRESMKKGEA